MYTDIPGEFKIVLESHSAKPYTATVRVEEYKPKNMKGVIADGGDKPLVDFKKLGGGDVAGGAGTDIMENLIPGRMPDLDLHVYDVYGNHVGMNYDTWEYEVNISGAVASGDLKDSPEWVFFPEGTQISRSYVSAEKAKLYLEDNPQLKQYAAEVKSTIEYLKFDADGNRYSASGGQASVGPYTTASIKSPGDGSLAYAPDSIPGSNNNEGAGGCCPTFIFMILLGGLLYAKLHTGL